MKNKFFSQYILLLFLALPMFERSPQTDEHREEVLAKPQFKRVLTVEEVLTVQPKVKFNYSTQQETAAQSQKQLTNNCYISIDADGMKSTNATLEDTACSLRQLIFDKTNTDFKVYNVSALPTLGFGKGNDGFLSAKEEMKNAHPNTYCLKIVNLNNYFNPDQIYYEVFLNLPKVGAFVGIDEFVEEYMESEVRKAFNSNFRDKETGCLNAMNRLKQLLVQQNASSLMSKEFLLNLGFEVVSMEDLSSLNKITSKDASSHSGNIHDYAGLAYDSTITSNLHDNLALGLGDLSGYTKEVVLTDNDNYTDISTVDFVAANSYFKASNTNFTFWLHYYKKDNEVLLFSKSKCNLTEDQAETFLKIQVYDKINYSQPNSTLLENTERGADCSGTAWRTKCSGFYDEPSLNLVQHGLGCGMVDGFMDTVQLIADAGTALKKILESPTNSSFWSTLFSGQAIFEAVLFTISPPLYVGYKGTVFMNAHKEELKVIFYNIRELLLIFTDVGRYNDKIMVMASIYNGVLTHLRITDKNSVGQNITSGVKQVSYDVGLIGYSILEGILTEGIAAGLKGTKLIKAIRKIGDLAYDMKHAKLAQFMSKSRDVKQAFKCKILLQGCFVKGTPVLMARNPLRDSVAGIALAALPIVTPVPIEEVKLFDYALAHKSVNSSYGLTASKDDTFIIGKDPYTSDQQVRRDQYEINDTDWNEVTFEQVVGTSKCKLALNNDWIAQNNYSAEATVNMNLPEQGISGPFKITSIKHIIPQKRPVDEDPDDEYEYRPVTGLFIHESNDIWKITFDDGTKLGVTNNHPVYSVSKGDWQQAGYLEIGEEVLAKSGNTKVISKERDLTIQPVYNLEIKEHHNFLVGSDGVVAHNTPGCLDEFLEFLGKWRKKKHSQFLDYAVESGLPSAKEIAQFQDLGVKTGKRFFGLGDSPRTKRPYPGIDGFDEGGKGISLKIADKADSAGGLMGDMVNLADELNKGIVYRHEDHAGLFNKIDGMITAKLSNKNWLKQRWQSKLNDQKLNTDIIDKLYIESSEGWMVWDSKTGIWTDM